MEGEWRRAYFPGLIPAEDRLWRRWLREHERDFARFAYNLRVGQGIPAPPDPVTGSIEEETPYRRMWHMITQRRIDVVGWRGDETWLFEIEERPGARAVGQLAMYEQLYTDQWPDTGFIQLAVIAEAISPDVRRVLEEQEALVFLYPPAEAGGAAP